MPVTSPKAPAPARTYPNQNSLHGLRFFFDSTPVPGPLGLSSQPTSGLKLNTPVLVGTVPRHSFVCGCTVHVKQGTTGAATLDIGTKANPTRFKAAGPLNAVVRDDALVSTGGWIGNEDTPIYATLKGSSDLSNGIFSFLIYYYSKSD